MKTILVECAWAATRCKQEGKDYLRNKYYSLLVRTGHKKALIAIGHKILCAVWYMLKNKQAYCAPDMMALNQKIRAKQLNRYLEKIKHLGYQVSLQL